MYNASTLLRQFYTPLRSSKKGRVLALSTHVEGRLQGSAIPNFSCGKEVYKRKTTGEIIRALVVLRLCGVQQLVFHAPRLLALGEKVLGRAVVNKLLRLTFFGHFCAGEDQAGITPTVHQLEAAGVGSILDYAAEADEGSTPGSTNQQGGDSSFRGLQQKGDDDGSYVEGPVARVYHYVDEPLCDKHVDIFKECIEAVHAVAPTGFAAIKVTALGPPALLKRLSTVIVEVRNLFEKFDQDDDGLISEEEFAEAYRQYFMGDTPGEGSFEDLLETVQREAGNGAGLIDYVEWANGLNLTYLAKLTNRCRDWGPLSQAVLTADEIEAVMSLTKRLASLASLAEDRGVRLMVDAEQTYFQPAIDALVYALQQKHNRPVPGGGSGGGSGGSGGGGGSQCTVFSTYQCYLKDSDRRLVRDLARSKRRGYNFGAKLVRGAYLLSERERAVSCGYASPVHDTLEDTHAAYHRAVDLCLEHMVAERGPGLSSAETTVSLSEAAGAATTTEFMVASHNQESVEYVLSEMHKRGMLEETSEKRRVYFGQLLGMSDNLTFQLGAKGFHAYKYVPYGPVEEVLPYLLRRAQENSAMLGAAQRFEIGMLQTELLRRVTAGASLSK